MRIGINALYLLPGKVGGSEIYVRNLVKWLPKAGGDNEYFIFINKESAGVFEKLAPEVTVIPCPVRAENRPMRILWEEIMLPFQVKKHKLDALISAGMSAPFFCPAPSFVVIYDLQHINQPQNFNKLYLIFLRAVIYLSAKLSKGVITLSERSKADIVKYYKISPERISVTYLASDASIFYKRGPEEVSAIARKYSLPKRFLLYIASSLPHKNYVRLLDAFKIVKEKDPEIKLVLIGARDYGQDIVSKRINEIGLKDDVVFLGWLPFEDIPVIYSAAEAFVFPSLHEGFGIPVLEAFACGVPVVCSRIEPLTEFASPAALFVDPLSPDDIARGILSILRDNRLRERLVKEGLKRANDFSWEKTVENTLSAVYSCIERGGKKEACGTSLK